MPMNEEPIPWSRFNVVNQDNDVLETHIIPNDPGTIHIADKDKCWCGPEIVSLDDDGSVNVLHRFRH